MKRIILILLTGILLYLLTSCKGEHPSDVSIGFTSELTPFDTKALVTNVTDLQTSSGLSIYALRFPTGTGSPISTLFDNINLTYSSPNWVYTGLKYWIPGQTYKFISLYPYSASAYTYTPAESKVTTTYTSALTTNPNQTDLMYSVNERLVTSTVSASPVPLNMKHATSSLTFKLRNVSVGNITVSNISLTGLYYQGSCTIANTATPCTWSTTGAKEIGNTRYPGKTSGLSSLPINASTYYELFSERILVIPQQVQSNTDIKINLTVAPAGSTQYTLNLSLSTSTTVTEWLPSKHYVYTISITESRILFDVEVLDWIEEEVTLK